MEVAFNPPFLGKCQRPHFCDEVTDIGDFCKSFGAEVAKLVNKNQNDAKSEPTIESFMEMSKSAVEEVAQICSVDQLTCDGEDMLERKLKVDTDLDGKSNFPNLPDMSLPLGEDIDEQAAQVLESLKTRKRRQNIIKRRTAVAKMLFGTLRFSSEVRLESDEASKPARRHGLRPGSTTEPVITVRVYQPPAASTTVGSCLSWFNMSQEVACLGSNRLTQLRDVITCPEDQLVTNDCSVAPRGTPRQQAKSMYPSGFFCINRVFYVDQRDPKHIDYSEPIRKWAAAQLAGDLPTRSMEDVCFSDLSVRLGYPYIYVHQGCCQHLLVFSDVRLFHQTSVADPQAYPVVQAVRRSLRQVCQVCDRQHARWLTMDHELTPTNPTYFCETCFRGFNYRAGRRMGSFRAYPYEPDPPAAQRTTARDPAAEAEGAATS